MKNITTIKAEEIKQLKNYWLHKNDPKPEVYAKSNDFIFDRKNLKIIKKGQMKLL